MDLVMYTTRKGDANLGGVPEHLTWHLEKDAFDAETFDPSMNMSVKDSRAINVYPEVRYQIVMGFGAALTQASALNLLRMPEDKRKEIYNAYFSEKTGIGYRYCRLPMGSCDFCEEPYEHVEQGDEKLKTFSLRKEEETVFRVLLEIEKYTGQKPEVIATPWSPPAWMKDNGNRCNGGKLQKKYYQLWAEYFVKYITEVRKRGVNLTAISIQNEPNANVTWDSCIYTAEEESVFLKEFLGPNLEKNGLGDVKILIWDHNKDLLVDRAREIMKDEKAAKYVWGAAFHWYAGDHFEALDIVRQMYPDLKLFYTEGCHGGVYRKTGKWCSGEILAHELFGDLNHGTNACIDWNMVLNEQGGPSYAENYCDAPVICDNTYENYHLESSFYYIGHFSKFVRPGAIRIGCSKFSQQTETCAFENKDGQIVLVVMNKNEEELSFCIRCNGKIAFAKMDGHSIATLLF